MDAVLILTGFMGVGKTSVGRLLAGRLGWGFADVDDEVEAAAGKTISALFAEEGEARFRELEAEALVRLLARSRVVVATGGGVLLREGNRRLLEGRRVYYLHAAVEECLRRLRGSATPRPLLSGSAPDAAAARIFADRRPLYESLGLRVETEGKTPEEIADEILCTLRKEEGA